MTSPVCKHWIFQESEKEVLVFELMALSEDEDEVSDDDADSNTDAIAFTLKAMACLDDEQPKRKVCNHPPEEKRTKPSRSQQEANIDDSCSKEGSKDMDRTPMTQLHKQGKCMPCRYFRFRKDGCRQGEACAFCHECTAEESMAGQKWLKHQHQREKRRQKRRQAWQ
ncbi:unnamed protein product [Effrenium voratum]|uniref:C3H1-type domain-containing protein n=2 Tax=Effrenium voratum TaxID=2562239 RepID=A0AA36N3C0_9DINO|nr:unnamed protein product [Effrenium voratum]CAJ1389101.1 unnamed protein product [Effrenium voratum]|mmetsp:Transcript_51176/g.122584  ORF Transcript_51176/g.122584 Transcript_51176/m.122584 type:complete len:167 (-) Transcript_51176:81-581(-)